MHIGVENFHAAFIKPKRVLRFSAPQVNSDAHPISCHGRASRTSTTAIFLRYNGASPGTHSMGNASKSQLEGSAVTKTTANKPLTSAPTQPANGSGSPSSNLDMLRRMYSAMLRVPHDGRASTGWQRCLLRSRRRPRSHCDSLPRSNLRAGRYHCRFPSQLRRSCRRGNRR